MNLEDLADFINRNAGDARRESFALAIHEAARIRAKVIVETGTYRGIEADGLSTLNFALLAEVLGGTFYSIDINLEHIEKAKKRVGDHAVYFIGDDSVTILSMFQQSIDVLYLDSYDYDVNKPLPSQLHQMAEIGAAYGKLSPKAIVLLDDCNIPYGGKGHFTSMFLVERGWKLIYDGYQKLFVRS